MSGLPKIALGLFLIAHGLVHLLYFVPSDDPKYPMTAKRSWLVTRAGVSTRVISPIVSVLAVAGAVGFVALALCYWGLLVPGAWLEMIATVAVTVSMLLLAVTWNNQFVVAVLINIAIAVWATLR